MRDRLRTLDPCWDDVAAKALAARLPPTGARASLNSRTWHVAADLFPEIDSTSAARAAANGLPPRRRLYGIGPGKSGTTALASLFKGSAAAHEPEPEPLIRGVLEHVSGRTGWESLEALIRDRDDRLALVVDVSNINIFLVDLLVPLAAGARFVLTIRDCYSWLDSILNHYLRVTPTAAWREFATYRFGADGRPHPREERLLADHGLFTLAGYLNYWTAHLSKALTAVPPERLLVVRPQDIVRRAAEIAAFAGLDAADVNLRGLREYRNPDKRRIVQEIPQAYLAEQVDRHCGPLMGRLFPDIRSPLDAGLG